MTANSGRLPSFWLLASYMGAKSRRRPKQLVFGSKKCVSPACFLSRSIKLKPKTFAGPDFWWCYLSRQFEGWLIVCLGEIASCGGETHWICVRFRWSCRWPSATAFRFKLSFQARSDRAWVSTTQANFQHGRIHLRWGTWSGFCVSSADVCRKRRALCCYLPASSLFLIFGCRGVSA